MRTVLSDKRVITRPISPTDRWKSVFRDFLDFRFDRRCIANKNVVGIYRWPSSGTTFGNIIEERVQFCFLTSSRILTIYYIFDPRNRKIISIKSSSKKSFVSSRYRTFIDIIKSARKIFCIYPYATDWNITYQIQ